MGSAGVPPASPCTLCSQLAGINVRVLKELFAIAAEEGLQEGWAVQVSVVEIYNDAVHDLLRYGSVQMLWEDLQKV